MDEVFNFKIKYVIDIDIAILDIYFFYIEILGLKDSKCLHIMHHKNLALIS